MNVNISTKLYDVSCTCHCLSAWWHQRGWDKKSASATQPRKDKGQRGIIWETGSEERTRGIIRAKVGGEGAELQTHAIISWQAPAFLHTSSCWAVRHQGSSRRSPQFEEVSPEEVSPPPEHHREAGMHRPLNGVRAAANLPTPRMPESLATGFGPDGIITPNYTNDSSASYISGWPGAVIVAMAIPASLSSLSSFSSTSQWMIP